MHEKGLAPGEFDWKHLGYIQDLGIRFSIGFFKWSTIINVDKSIEESDYSNNHFSNIYRWFGDWF
jgi:hypothetical protein